MENVRVAAASDGETRMPSSSSSFAAVPPALLIGSGWTALGRVRRWVVGEGRPGRRAAAGPAGPAGPAGAARQLLGVLAFGDGTATNFTADVWAVLQASVFRGGRTASAAPYLVAAALLHNARRQLWPALGSCAYLLPQPPVEDVRAARSRPDLFVAASLAAATVPSWTMRVVVASLLQKRLWDVVAGGLCGVVVTWPRLPPTTTATTTTTTTKLRRTLARRAQDAAAVLFVLWLFSCIEYAVARCVHAGSLAYACAVLLRNDNDNDTGGPAALYRLLTAEGRLSGLVFVAVQLVLYPLLAVLPLCAAAVREARHRRPGLLLALLTAGAALDTLQRYRTKLYLAIEAGGFFVVLAFLGVSGLLMQADARGRSRRSTRRPDGKQAYKTD